MTSPTSDLAAVATGFSRSLRRAGLDAPTSATLDFAEALSILGTSNPAHVFWAGRACFCQNPEDSELYGATFLAFFGRRLERFPGGRLTTVPPQPLLPSPPVPQANPPDAPARGDEAESDQHSMRDEPLLRAFQN